MTKYLMAMSALKVGLSQKSVIIKYSTEIRRQSDA